MSEELNEEQKLVAENEFLKMKMMLEHGPDIQFGCAGSAQVENDFLKHIIEFEKQRTNPVYTTVYKKLGSPTHFKPVNEIAVADMESSLNRLMEYMHARGISLSCCSPNISARELYRFTLEELFDKQINDMDIPDLVECFSYDDFHPDYEYENTQAAVDDCIDLILSKEPLDFLPRFNDENIRFNSHEGLSEKEFKIIVNRFKELFDDILLRSVESKACMIEGNKCIVKGNYAVDLITKNEKIGIENNWMVEFLFREDCGYWYIVNVQLEGI